MFDPYQCHLMNFLRVEFCLQEVQLKTEAQRNSVSITINKRNGTIELKGHEKDVNELNVKIMNVLFSAKMEMLEEQGGELLAQFVSTHKCKILL